MGSDRQNTSCGDEWDKSQERIWFLLILQFIVAIAGNGFAIYRFVVHERMWHTGIVYAFNLAISDTLYAFSLLPMAAYYYPPKDWKYGSVFCKLDRFFFFCNLYGSTFFVACISLNRYVAIVHPFFAHGRIEARHAKLVSGVVWLLVIAISAPVLHFSTLKHIMIKNTSTTYCIGSAIFLDLPSYWPYSLFLAAFGCGLPFILTAFSCMAIVCRVIQSQSLTAEEKRKVKTLVLVVVVLYALIYLPFHALRNLNLYNLMSGKCISLVYYFYQAAKILVHFHICIHPLVYAALADSMQEYCCRCFQPQKEMSKEEENEGLRLRKQTQDFQDQS
nr:P2Y purinoceptor 11 [Pogona vitticeps]